jgi:DNA polymerase II large subunit
MEKSGKEILKERFEVLKYNWDLIEQMARELYSEFSNEVKSGFDDLLTSDREYWYRTAKMMLAKLHLFKK